MSTILHSVIVEPGETKSVPVQDFADKIDVRIVRFEPSGTDRSVKIESGGEEVLTVGLTNATGEVTQPLGACFSALGYGGKTIEITTGTGCAALVNITR